MKGLWAKALCGEQRPDSPSRRLPSASALAGHQGTHPPGPEPLSRLAPESRHRASLVVTWEGTLGLTPSLKPPSGGELAFSQPHNSQTGHTGTCFV